MYTCEKSTWASPLSILCTLMPQIIFLLRAGLHCGPWSHIMEDGLFQLYEFMVQLPWPNFFKINFESFGLLTRCKPNVDQEERPCTKKWKCWYFFSKLCPKKRIYKKKLSLLILLYSLGLYLSLLLSLMCRRCGLQIFSQQFLQK